MPNQVQLADGTSPVLLSTPIKVKAMAIRWPQPGQSGNPQVSRIAELVFGQPTLPTPTCSPPNQSATTPLNVAVSIEGHPDASIRFSLARAAGPTDDTYLTPIHLESPATLSVWASKPGYAPTLGTARYGYLITPVLSVSATPVPGLIELGGSVILSVPSGQMFSGTTIFYTTDGSAPTVLSRVYSAPIQVSANTTIRALGVCAGFQDGTFSGAYTTFIPARAATDVIISSSGTLTPSIPLYGSVPIAVDAVGTLTPTFVQVSGTAPVSVSSVGTLTPTFVQVSGTAPVSVSSAGTLTPRGGVLSSSCVWMTATSDNGVVIVAAARDTKIFKWKVVWCGGAADDGFVTLNQLFDNGASVSYSQPGVTDVRTLPTAVAVGVEYNHYLVANNLVVYNVSGTHQVVFQSVDAGTTNPLGKIYTSVNSGDTWSTGGSTEQAWHWVACSGSGAKIMALARTAQGGPGGPMLVSSDYGASWATRTPPPGSCETACLSQDGSVAAVLFTVQTGGVPLSGVHVSSDFGVTWTPRPFPSAFSAIGMAMSDDGSKLAVLSGVADANGTRIFTSSDSGLTWTLRTTGLSNTGFAGSGAGISMKGDGSEVFVCTRGFNAGFVYLGLRPSGSEFGSQWSQIPDPFGGGAQNSRVWQSIGTSRNGTTRAGTFQGDLFWVYGQAVAYNNTFAHFPNTISLSEDGMKVVVGSSNGPVYRSVDSGWTWTTIS